MNHLFITFLKLNIKSKLTKFANKYFAYIFKSIKFTNKYFAYNFYKY